MTPRPACSTPATIMKQTATEAGQEHKRKTKTQLEERDAPEHTACARNSTPRSITMMYLSLITRKARANGCEANKEPCCHHDQRPAPTTYSDRAAEYEPVSQQDRPGIAQPAEQHAPNTKNLSAHERISEVTNSATKAQRVNMGIRKTHVRHFVRTKNTDWVR